MEAKLKEIHIGNDGNYTADLEVNGRQVTLTCDREYTQLGQTMEDWSRQPFDIILADSNLYAEVKESGYYKEQKVAFMKVLLHIDGSQGGIYLEDELRPNGFGRSQWLMIITEDTIKKNRADIMKEQDWFADCVEHYKDSKLAYHINNYIKAYLDVMEIYDNCGVYDVYVSKVDDVDVSRECGYMEMLNFWQPSNWYKAEEMLPKIADCFDIKEELKRGLDELMSNCQKDMELCREQTATL